MVIHISLAFVSPRIPLPGVLHAFGGSFSFPPPSEVPFVGYLFHEITASSAAAQNTWSRQTGPGVVSDKSSVISCVSWYDVTTNCSC